jgi:hypothetical protein
MCGKEKRLGEGKDDSDVTRLYRALAENARQSAKKLSLERKRGLR